MWLRRMCVAGWCVCGWEECVWAKIHSNTLLSAFVNFALSEWCKVVIWIVPHHSHSTGMIFMQGNVYSSTSFDPSQTWHYISMFPWQQHVASHAQSKSYNIHDSVHHTIWYTLFMMMSKSLINKIHMSDEDCLNYVSM